MNKEILKERIKIEQAYVDDAVIQFKNINSENWQNCYSPVFNWEDYDYRIRPTLTYIPFTFEDREMFRGKWIRNKKNINGEFLIFSIYSATIKLDNGYSISLTDLFNLYEFIDGTPCGKLQQNN